MLPVIFPLLVRSEVGQRRLDLDHNGSAIASNDNWQDDINSPDVEKNGLSPTNALESAIVLHLPAGAYTAIVSGADGGTGVGLAEVYELD